MAQGSSDIPQVGAMDKSKRNSEIAQGSESQQSSGPAAPTSAICYLASNTAPGAEICSAGTRLRCGDDGVWYNVGRC
jgi:hypothetical protein